MEEDLEKDLKNLMYIIEMHHISSELIQNLIARYNELEEKDKKWEEVYDEDQEQITNLNNKIFDLENRNKGLEKLAEGIEKIRDITIPAKTDFIIVMRENYLPYLREDVILKSKVKEKIEELKKYGNNLTEEQRQKKTEFLQGKLKAYEELLED